MLESIEKLRKCITSESPLMCVLVRKFTNDDGMTASDEQSKWALANALDALEKEVAERYIELPVDADGVPVRVGDRVVCNGKKQEVVAIGYDYYIFGKRSIGRQLKRDGWNCTANCKHAGDSFEDIINDAIRIGHPDAKADPTCGDISFSELVARCKALAGEQ